MDRYTLVLLNSGKCLMIKPAGNVSMCESQTKAMNYLLDRASATNKPVHYTHVGTDGQVEPGRINPPVKPVHRGAASITLKYHRGELTLCHGGTGATLKGPIRMADSQSWDGVFDGVCRIMDEVEA